jgi:prepilin-type N-terminal cleavage/methylation domain-containing protein
VETIGVKKENRFNRKGGFTLIELLVALAVFGFMVVILTGIFTTVLKINRKATSIQEAQESGRYLMESMMKEIRMSSVNTGSSNGVATISITNPHMETFDYAFDSVNKRLLKNGQAISPDNVEVAGSFYIETAAYPSRAKVTITMSVKAKNNSAGESELVKLQNTVAGRGH